VSDLEALEARVASLEFNSTQQANRIRTLEKQVETLWTPPWKKLLFGLDGWPLYRLAAQPAWRPWRRWWRS
jgi:hypothetical protein